MRHPELFLSRMERQIPVVTLPFRNEADLVTVGKLVGLLKGGADVVIPSLVKDYWLVGLAAKIARVPNVMLLEVERRLRDHYIMDRLRYGVFPDRILVNAAMIIDTLCETPWMRREIIDPFYAGMTAHGVPTAEQRLETRRGLGVPDNALFIAGSGRFGVEKRWDWLVKVVAEAVERGENVHCILFGTGPERSKIEDEIARHQLEARFKLPGLHPDYERIIGTADMLAHPSEREGMPFAMLEAMACGVPVVATLSGGIGEKFFDDRNILLAPTQSYDEFAVRFHRLVQSSQLRERIGLAGLETIRTEFAWDTMTDTIMVSLEKAIRNYR